MNAAAAAKRGLWQRAVERVRFGLVTQELLDAMARAGLLVYPYWIVEERFGARPQLDATLRRYSLRALGADDAGRVAGLECRPLDLERTRQRLGAGECHGLFDGSRLLGYTWAKFDCIGSAGHSLDAIGPLPGRAAYLHDAYVARAARGLQLAPAMRHGVHAALAARGFERCFSITTFGNESSRRFKRKLGAQEVELRMIVGRVDGLAADLRLWRRAPQVQLPRFQWMRPPR